ncbi:MAG: ABC transporter permease [Deltaproteobacteria bacterium]|nr:ABC transporter permease [Deltaproteobacteria bacterium]
MRILWAFFKRDLLIETGYRLSFALQIIGIFPAILMFFFLSKLVDSAASESLQSYGGHYFPFVIIGIAVQNYLTISISGFSNRISESQLSGTLEAVLATPIKLSVFLTGSTIYGFVFNFFRIFLYLIVGTIFFDVTFHWSRLLVTLVSFPLIIASFAALGIGSAAFIILFKRGNPVVWGISVLSWLLGGVYYPVSLMPECLQTIASFIPMTHALELLRQGLIVNKATGNIAGHLSALAAWTFIGLPFSFWCFGKALNRSKMKGSLGHY